MEKESESRHLNNLKLGTHTIKKKTYNIYKYGVTDFEFFFIGNEEKKFWALLKKYKSGELIPNYELLKGIFFANGTRDTGRNYVNRHIIANQVRK